MKSLASRAAAILIALVTAACARGADEARLRQDVQDKLNRDVKPGLFEVVGIRREGSAPLPAGEDGADRVVVYYNVTLKLADTYEFGEWGQLGPASVAYALGATEKGVFGLTAKNQVGDLVRAYGTAIYQRDDTGWVMTQPLPASSAAAPTMEGTAPLSQSKQLIDRLAAMVELPPPGVPAQQDAIIAEELAAASENIERRVKRREHTFTFATGPDGGEYARFGGAIIDAIHGAVPDVKLRQRHSPGSVENAWLLSRGEADYAILQGDVAVAAHSGGPPFDRSGPLESLRAVTGLFPEALHIVVLRDSPIRDVASLRGRRVAIGEANSGSRFDAVAVLAAHRLQLSDLAEAAELGLADALSRLRNKGLDAVMVTGLAPIRALQALAVSPGLRLLPLGAAALDSVVAARPGLAPIVLPANTYPQQPEPVATAAALALLVTTTEAPAAEVQRLAGLMATLLHRPHSGRDAAPASASPSPHRVSIPLHAGVERQDH